MEPGSIKKLVVDNIYRVDRGSNAIEDFFSVLENDRNLKNQYDCLVDSSNTKTVNSQIGKLICRTLGMQFNKRENPSQTSLIGSYSILMERS